MASAHLGTSNEANREYLTRLQMLIIDGGLSALQNYANQKLITQSVSLSSCIANEKHTITRLKGRGILSQPQYDLLQPSSGNVVLSDLDITLIICLLRNLKFFGLKSTFDWNSTPGQTDFSIEADIYRLKSYRNEISHISTTTGIQKSDFKTMWKEIEQILLRINSSSVNPLPNLQQSISYFKTNSLDPKAERRLKYEIEKWTKLEKAIEIDLKLLKASYQEIKHTQTQNYLETCEIKEDLKKTRNEISKLEHQLNEKINLEDQVVYDQRKQVLKGDLITFYIWRHSKIPLSPIFDEEDTLLANFYIKPTLNVKSISEMLNVRNNDNREIYLIADAGFGKTVFSKYLAILWCQAHSHEKCKHTSMAKDDIECLHVFEFVFLILLRDSYDLCSIEDLIFEQIVSNLANSKSFTKDFLQEIFNRERCLVILDGLDEWTHPEKLCYRGSKSIPHRNPRELCTVLTTARPWKFGALNLSSNEIGKKVELKKLSGFSAQSLIKQSFTRLKSYPDETSLQNDVDLFNMDINITRNEDLITVPLLLTYIVCLWCDGVQLRGSKCNLYVNIIELLLSRMIQKHGEIQQPCETDAMNIPKCLNEHSLCIKYLNFLLHLGKLAFHTLSSKTIENLLTFESSVADIFLKPEDMKLSLRSGILLKSTTKTLTQEISKFSFSHKTVQEFFAALVLSSQRDGERLLLEKCENIRSILENSVIFEFVSSMNANLMCTLSKGFMHVINEDEITRTYRTMASREIFVQDKSLHKIQNMFLSCLEEMPENESSQLCLQDMFIDRDCLYNKRFQSLSKLNKTNIKSLFIDTSETGSSVDEIFSLFSLKDLKFIHRLHYNGYNRKETDVNMLLFPSLESLSLLSCQWTICEQNLDQCLVNLQYFCIGNFTVCHRVLETIFNFITVQKSMKELSLAELYCKEHGRGCKILDLNLSNHLQLKMLDLQWLPPVQLNVTTPSLEAYHLSGIQLGEKSVLLSTKMMKIVRLELVGLDMLSAECLQHLINVSENLQQSISINMVKITPTIEYEHIKSYIRNSQTFSITDDTDHRPQKFMFKVIKPR